MAIVSRKEAEEADVLPVKLCKKPQYQAFLRTFKDGVDPTKMQIQSGATLVPLTDEQGDIPGEVSPYGTVVQGENTGPGMRVTGLVYMRRLSMRDRAARRVAATAAVDNSADADDISAAMSGKQASVLPIPGNESVEPAADIARELALLQAEALQAPRPVAAPKAAFQVELAGAFGKGRMTCRAVERHANMIILVQDADADSYEPPASDQLCTLTCKAPGGSWTSKVYSVGIAFPVKSLNAYIQVFTLES